MEEAFAVNAEDLQEVDLRGGREVDGHVVEGDRNGGAGGEKASLQPCPLDFPCVGTWDDPKDTEAPSSVRRHVYGDKKKKMMMMM